MEITSLITRVSEVLKHQGLTIATAESCTGGLLAHYLTSISGSSSYFDSGIVSYSNQAKQDYLDVKDETLQKYGAVSEHIAQEMASGIRAKAKVDIGVSTTGIAGPTGGTLEKPVGLVFISILTPDREKTKKFIFLGNRLEIKESTCNAALKMIIENI